MIHVIGARHEGRLTGERPQVSVRQLRIPLNSLGLAMVGITYWGRATEAEQRWLDEHVSQRPDLFPVTTQTRNPREEGTRTALANWDASHLALRQGDVVEAGYHAVIVEGKPVQGMARRIEQGLGIAAMDQGLSVERTLQQITFTATSPDQCDELIRAIGTGAEQEEFYRATADLYPPPLYVADQYGVLVPAAR